MINWFKGLELQKMNWSWKMLWLPLFFLILLGLSSFIFFYSYRNSTSFEHDAVMLSTQIRQTIFSQVENTARVFTPLISSASSLAGILTSSIPLNGTLSFDLIQERVAPSLFVAFSTIPYVSHASYVGRDGLMFLYLKNNTKNGEIFAEFSNSSSSSSPSMSSCYTQPVNRESGQLSGHASACSTRIKNLNFSGETTNMTAAVSGSLFVYNAALMGGRGVITLGYPIKVVARHYSRLDFYNGDLHLATSGGRVLVESKINGSRILVRNRTVLVEAADSDGNVEERTGYLSCKSDNGGLTNFTVKIRGSQRVFYCSTLEIGGIESYPFPWKEWRVQPTGRGSSFILLVLVLAITVVSFGAFIVSKLRSARKEMLLRSALIKQMEATQQAERKSMNKSMAFATASHDIRASLAAISGLVDLSREIAKPKSELAANLEQMSACSVHLLGLLNSVLDISKIEAGKKQLEEEEFNVAQLLEDVVDMFYPLGMKKGVDVVLDPTDCTILKYNLVKGDSGKLKQIICNLLSNATKVTSEGHITVRAMVRKSSTRKEIAATNSKSLSYYLSRIWYKQKGSFTNLEDAERVEVDHNCMEYIFEVDDTGKGIPKERREFVFENFVQVKETALGEGTGLGLGIIQSLVRLMGGEIAIVDKDERERGTCFRFSVVLTACHLPAEDDMQGTHRSNDGYPTKCIHRCFGMHADSLATRSDASHVILFLASKERRKVTKRLMRRFGLRVSTVERSNDLFHALESIEKNMSLPQSWSYVSEDIDTLYESEWNYNIESSWTKDEAKPRSLLIVIDANAASASELCTVLGNLREHIRRTNCEIVLLRNSVRRNDSEEVDDQRRTIPCHYTMSRPLHGSHLYRVLKLLPEFRGASPRNSSITEELRPSSHDSGADLQARSPDRENEVMVVGENGRNMKPLIGKNVLLVEDNRMLSRVSMTVLQNIGASVQVCGNGKEAFDLVCTNLRDKEEGSLPFDYIFMDCKMPFMDGFEATRLIRKEEQAYGVRTPIVAVTAYSASEEIKRAYDAGMDFHLPKPIKIDSVLDLIRPRSL